MYASHTHTFIRPSRAFTRAYWHISVHGTPRHEHCAQMTKTHTCTHTYICRFQPVILVPEALRPHSNHRKQLRTNAPLAYPMASVAQATNAVARNELLGLQGKGRPPALMQDCGLQAVAIHPSSVSAAPAKVLIPFYQGRKIGMACVLAWLY